MTFVYLVFNKYTEENFSTGNSNGETAKLTLPQFLKYNMRGKLIVSLELPPQGSNYIFRSYKVNILSTNNNNNI